MLTLLRGGPTAVTLGRGSPHEARPARIVMASLARLIHVHSTQNYASWLNQMKRWVGLITQRATRCGSFWLAHDSQLRIRAIVACCDRSGSPCDCASPPT